MRNSNDNLSRCASALLRAYGDITSYEDDPMSSMAPRECFDLVVCNWDDKVSDILTYWGYDSGDDFLDDFAERTNSKCAYSYGFIAGGV